jgi:hypothetical protein
LRTNLKAKTKKGMVSKLAEEKLRLNVFNESLAILPNRLSADD